MRLFIGNEVIGASDDAAFEQQSPVGLEIPEKVSEKAMKMQRRPFSTTRHRLPTPAIMQEDAPRRKDGAKLMVTGSAHIDRRTAGSGTQLSFGGPKASGNHWNGGPETIDSFTEPGRVVKEDPVRNCPI